MAARPVVAPGDLVTYTIKLINSSPLAVTANVTDPVPSQLTYVTGSATGGGVYDAGSQTLSWSAINVPPFGACGAIALGGHRADYRLTDADRQCRDDLVRLTLVRALRAGVVIFDRPVPPPHPILGGSVQGGFAAYRRRRK
ncbi:MAG: DUF11 domain-containing protein [Anaerolineae bacterium]